MSDIYVGPETDGLVTGEAVTLDLPPASIGLRVASGLIDLLAELLLLLGALFVMVTLVNNQALLAIGLILVFSGSLVLVPAAIETFTRGRSLGKLLLGTRTVRSDAGPITARHAVLRAMVGFVELWMMSGVPALICSLVTAKGQRVGDLVAGTYVVRDRLELRLPPVVGMPPALAAWAHRADIAPLPEGLAIAVRQLLGRLDTLSPDARQRLLVENADRVLGYVSPPPPRDTPADAFLAAVQAERRDRDARRLAAEQQLRARLARR